MIFRDRQDAGRLLADRLLHYRDDPKALILALPRGGVPVGYILSQALRLPLDVFITRKLGAPDNPEFAIGAVAEDGYVYLNPEAQAVLDAYSSSMEYLEEAIRVQKEEIARRQQLYRQGRGLPKLADRIVLLVDDGIATGSTFCATLEALRSQRVKRIVAAIPVGPADTLSKIRHKVDEVVVLRQPDPFYAVGQAYMDFRQVEDREVIRYLNEAATAARERDFAARRAV